MNIIRDFVTKINEKQKEISESMLNGNCVNFESYQRLVGQSIGLKEALDILNNLLEEERKDVE